MVTKKDVIISNDLRSLFDLVGKPRFLMNIWQNVEFESG